MKPWLCPVCNGKGRLPPPEDFAGYCNIPYHGCNGKGWVEVSEDAPVTAEFGLGGAE